jgi:ribose 5-phosphate isomerase A
MTSIASQLDLAKRRAAEKAVELVADNYVIGLGSGSTAAHAIRAIGRRVQEEKLQVLGVPTSHQALLEAVRSGVPITTLNEHPTLDIAIDGADELDYNLNLIKGGGGALTREKIVASAAKMYIIIADERKLVHRLGEKNAIPVEVVPFALPTLLKSLKDLGFKVKLRVGSGKVGPVVTDNGNLLLDIYCKKLEDPEQLDGQLRRLPGMVETGLFIGMTDAAYLGRLKGGVRKLSPR